tara:strand:+ start:397 stop:651 length:255 start_codon:yes stop_codon:yes gene_type:complete
MQTINKKCATTSDTVVAFLPFTASSMEEEEEEEEEDGVVEVDGYVFATSMELFCFSESSNHAIKSNNAMSMDAMTSTKRVGNFH